MKDLSIVIVSFNTQELLADCIGSIKEHTKGVDYEILIVDNGSQDGSVEWLKEEKGIEAILNKGNLGFAGANNQGIKKATGRYILLLNSDTELKENSLAKMIRWMDEHPGVGIATCKLLNPDGSTQANGGSFPTLLRVFLWGTFLDDIPLISRLLGSYHPHPHIGEKDSREHQQDWVSGAVFLIRKEVVKDLGGLEEEFFMYAEDVEYCLRAKKGGWEVWYIPQTSIVHIGSASSKGNSVKFSGKSLGKEKGILGEFDGLKRFHKKYYPSWQYPLLVMVLKLAAFLRILVFGILGRQKQAWRIYGKALATS